MKHRKKQTIPLIFQGSRLILNVFYAMQLPMIFGMYYVTMFGHVDIQTEVVMIALFILGGAEPLYQLYQS